MSHVRNVAIVGATGTVGKFIVDELLKAGKHQVTAVTRADSKAIIPDGLKVARVNYDDKQSLVDALRGQEVLIITMGVMAPREQSTKLIDAAGEAGVPWILPNEWGFDTDNQTLANDTLFGDRSLSIRKYIEEVGKSSWIAVSCGFWYEFSLGGGPDRYGFDFKNRTVTFFDDGLALLDTSTWAQAGRAVANLLALPTYPQENDVKSTTLSSFKNKYVYVSSFRVSQKDMFESVLRVTNTKEADWKINYEDSTSRYQSGLKSLQEGDRSGFTRCMYTRNFYPDGFGTFDPAKGPVNDVLGLPKEDLDEYTKLAVEEGMGTSNQYH